MLKPALIAPFALMLALPVLAETADPAPAPLSEDDGFSLMEEGAKLVLRGLMTEMEPTLNDMEDALAEMRPALEAMGPKLQELVALMGDVANYDAPVRLPNGDILIPRKPDAPPAPGLGEPLAPLPGPNGEIDL
jgi:hypothetical protein